MWIVTYTISGLTNDVHLVNCEQVQQIITCYQTAGAIPTDQHTLLASKTEFLYKKKEYKTMNWLRCKLWVPQ